MRDRSLKWLFILGALAVPLAIGATSALSNTSSEPTVRSVEEGNPMAPVGLDCQGGEAGLSSAFGVVGDGHPTGQEAVVSEVRGIPSLAEAPSSADIILVDSTTTETGMSSESYVLAKDGLVVARVTVYEHQGKWYVESTAKCVLADKAEA